MNIFGKQTTNSSQSTTNYCPHQVRSNFRSSIRKNEISHKLRQLREQILCSVSEDYNYLKDINLSETLHLWNQIDLEDVSQQKDKLCTCIKDFFRYSNSSQSDHIYGLFSQRNIQKLIAVATLYNSEIFASNQILYTQLLFTITGYVQYCENSCIQMPNSYMLMMKDMLRNLIIKGNIYEENKNQYFFNHFQLKTLAQISFYGLSQLNLDSFCYFEHIFGGQDSFGFIALQEGNKLLNYFRKHGVKSKSKDKQIAIEILNFLRKILIHSTQNKDQRQQLFDLDIYIVNLLLQFLTIPINNSPQLQQKIISTLRSFIVTHLSEQPQIILIHNFKPFFDRYKYYCQRLYSFMCTQMHNQDDPQKEKEKANRQSKQIQKMLIRYIEVIIMFYGINVPDQDLGENENPFYYCLETWLEDHVIPTLVTYFSQYDRRLDNVMKKFFILVKDLCYDEMFVGYILDEVNIMNQIFYYCGERIGAISLRKPALYSLAAMIRIAYDGQSSVRMEVANYINTKNAIGILADSIGEYAQRQLNNLLLYALKYWLQSQMIEVQGQNQNHLWSQFQAVGGVKRLQRVLQLEQSEQGEKNETYKLAESLLHQYKKENSL